MTDTNTTFETIYNTIFEEQPMPNDTAPSTLIDAAGEVVPPIRSDSRDLNILIEMSTAYQRDIAFSLFAHIKNLESRIATLEAAQAPEEMNDEDESPLTREVVFEMIGDRLEDFTSDYSFTSAVRDIADEAVGDIDWSSKIDAEEIVREGLREIL